MKISIAQVFIDGTFHPLEVQVQDGLIAAIAERIDDPDVLDAQGAHLYPGGIDAHIHGGFGRSFYENGLVEYLGHGEEQVREICERLLASDQHDLSDARFTLAYALAKLEDEPALERLSARYPALAAPRADDDAWILLARIALAHKAYRLADARRLVERLLASYPGCAAVLIRQMEIADGRFARIRVPAYGEDELIVAVSEGVVLLQEGMERTGKGVFGAWLARTVSELDPEAARAVAATTGEKDGGAEGAIGR